METETNTRAALSQRQVDAQAMERPSNAGWPSRYARVAMVGALVLLNAAAILSLKNIPTLDGPMLMYYVEAFRSLLAGHPVFHSYFQLHYTAGAHVFYFYLIVALSSVMSLLAAEKVVVVIYIAWLAYGFHYLVESIAPGRSFPAVLFVFPFAVNICVYWAFYDFSLALATALFVCGWWLRRFDRITPLRSAVWALLVMAMIAMHLMLTAIVLAFACIHLAAHLAALYFHESGAFARRARRAIYAVARPAAHIVAGAGLWLLFKPPGRLSQDGFPFFDQPMERLYQISVLRALSPFESRFYRGLLGIVIATAFLMTVAALWKRRRSLSLRAEWAVPLTAVAAFAAYFIAPFWMGDGAFVPQRFAVAAIFFLAASAALFHLSPRQGAALAAGLAVVSLAVLTFQYRMNTAMDRKYSAMLDLAPVAHGRLAAVMSDDDSNDPTLTFAPHFWAAVPYVRRSRMALLNSPWLDQRDKWLKVSHRQACQFLNPNLMRVCLARVEPTPDRPGLDLLIGVRGEPRPGSRAVRTERLARLYGLTVIVYNSPYFSIYARPGLAPSSGNLADNAAGPHK